MEEPSSTERRQVEIELLQAMYPEQIHFDHRSCELKYTSTSGAALVLRLPETYPERGQPEVISAANSTKSDVRTEMKSAILQLDVADGEEMLDAVIQGFESVDSTSNDVSMEAAQKEEVVHVCKRKTVVIWLHHLLNTNKRKLALGPTQSAATDGGLISGITKPGYPGILVYSGPEDIVAAHVAELRQQRWQAFQVRYEEDFEKGSEWQFEHGMQIREVESIADVAHGIVSDAHREAFLKATGVK